MASNAQLARAVKELSKHLDTADHVIEALGEKDAKAWLMHLSKINRESLVQAVRELSQQHRNTTDFAERLHQRISILNPRAPAVPPLVASRRGKGWPYSDAELEHYKQRDRQPSSGPLLILSNVPPVHRDRRDDNGCRQRAGQRHAGEKGTDNVANAIEGGRRTAGKRLLLVPKC